MSSQPELPEADHPSLRRQLRLRDLVLTQVLCVVGSSWVGIAAGLGRAQAVTWFAAMLIFYLPMAASVVCLNRQMPLEGGLYVWARRAFGNFTGFLVAWNLWVYAVAVVATILYAVPTELSYLIGPRAAWLPENKPASLAIVSLIVLLIALAAARGLNVGKWIHNIGGVAMLLVFAALILLPAWALLHHAPIHWEPFPLARPRTDLYGLALFGQMIFGALCGLEYIAILAGESRSPARSIGLSVVISSPIICAMFILGTGSVLAFTQGHIDFIAPIPQTLRLALGHNGFGGLFAMAAITLLQLRLIGAASYLFTGATRLSMAAGWDHLLPAWFTRLHPRFRTPTNSILFTSALILLTVLLATLGVHAQEAFQVLSNASICHYELTYMAMFLVPLAGAATLRQTLPRWLKVTSAVGLAATLFAFVISAYPFVDVVNTFAYSSKILGTTLFSNTIAIVFYTARARTRTLKDDKSSADPELIPEN